MPDPGRARHDSYAVKLPSPKPDYPALPWTCAGATMVNVYFEVLKGVLLDLLPPEFNRTSPPYCRLFVFDHPNSPAGAFRDASLTLGCRLTMMPAAFVAASMTNSPKVLAAGLFERGYPTALGTIDLELGKASARVSIKDAKGLLMTVILPSLQTIEPGRLAYDHVDAIKTSADGKTELLVTSPDLQIESAAICKDARIEYPDEMRDTPWHILRNHNIVSAQVARGARTFAAGHEPGMQAPPIPTS
ncbi:MAG: acetoacetate decarboxylase family protein [Candidatus Binataceae bacterium]